LVERKFNVPALREELSLKVSENMVLRNIFGSTMEEIEGRWRKLLYDKLIIHVLHHCNGIKEDYMNGTESMHGKGKNKHNIAV
jgi:hypothetical protein